MDILLLCNSFEFGSVKDDNITSDLKKHLESQYSTVKHSQKVQPGSEKQRAVTNAGDP